ncbi:hypothetical protein K7A42_23785 [Agrobacterium sp. InxBP2]|uniref:hypothetical protein n=1 Tax=Agrobacterium sp. InxBP2 TaxID=2870329 RepID=UPI00249E586A|nr:hypothetical protein [Agrobacterium sp. InxBP2]MCW8283929.1 hypothetical protein [Agrobacterium sp. InxBP2]
MASFKDLLDLLSASWPVALALLLAGLAILCGYEFELTAKYLRSLPEWTPGAAFVAVAIGGAILFAALAQAVVEVAARPVRQRRSAQWRKAHIDGLEDLSDPEKGILAWAYANRTKVFSAPYFHPVTKALTAKGYLQIPPGSHHSDETPFEIPDHIWEAVKDDLRDDDLTELVGLMPFSNR